MLLRVPALTLVVASICALAPRPGHGFEQTIVPHGFTAGGHAFVADVTITAPFEGAPTTYTLRRAVRVDGRETEAWQLEAPTGAAPPAWSAAGSVEMGRRVLADRRVAVAPPLAGTLDGRRAVVTSAVCEAPVPAPTDACPSCTRRDTRWRTVLVDGGADAVITLGTGRVAGATAPAAAMTRCPTVTSEAYWYGTDAVVVVRRERGATPWDALSVHDLTAPGTTMGATPVVRVARADERANAARRLAEARTALPGASDRAGAMLAVAEAALDAGDLGLAWDYFDAAHTLTGDDRAAVGRALVAFIGGTGDRAAVDAAAGRDFAEARALAAWLGGDPDAALDLLDGAVPVALARRLVAFDLEAGIAALHHATGDDPNAPGADELFDALLASGDHARIGPWIPQDGLDDPARLARLLRGARAVGRDADVLALTPPAIVDHPEQCAFYEVLGLAHLDVGDAAAAGPWLAAAVACDPDAEEATAGLALALHLSDAFDAAAALVASHLALGPWAGDVGRDERRERSAWLATTAIGRDVVVRRVACTPSAADLACTFTVSHAGDVSVDPVRVAGWLDGAETLLFDVDLGALNPGDTSSWDLTIPGPFDDAALRVEVQPESRRDEATVLTVRTTDGGNVTDLARSRFGP